MSQDKIAADVFRADKISLIDYTRNKLAADCMATQGYPQLDRAGIPRPASTYANMDPTSNLAYAGDVVTAQRLGFGKDEAAQSAHVVSFDPAFDHALLGCQQVANGKIGPDVVKVQSQVTDLVNNVSSDIAKARGGAGEQDQLNGWLGAQLDCLDRGGHHQVKSGARSLESYGVGDKKGHLVGPEPAVPAQVPGTVAVLPAAPARTYVPAPDEVSLAVAYARCSTETGFNDKIAGQSLRLERDSITTREAEIDALGPTVDELAKQAAKLVGQ